MILIFTLVAFLGASLLFVVQPMVGKLVLPVFGGASTVWAVVLLFFTTILLLGYGYVVWLAKKPKQQQFLWHGLLICVAVAWVLFNFLGKRSFISNQGFPFIDSLPILSLFLMLTKVLALPCFLLATTSVLLQSWYARTFSARSPYWLYIVSNIGSLLGLLAYPFIIEPNLTLRLQQTLWVLGFIIYAFLLLCVTYLIHGRLKVIIQAKPYKISTRKGWTWFALPFVATTAMLALTNQITQEISPVPFIWVATLGVYLLSFIVAFTSGRWYPRKFYGMLLLFFIGALSISTSGFIDFKFQIAFPLALAGLFIIDLVCHRELFRLRPKTEGLTSYYLMISFAGAAASAFVAIFAPILFNEIWEYPLVLIAAVFVALMVLLRKSGLAFRLHSTVFGILIVALVSWLFTYYSGQTLRDIPGSKIIASYRNFYGVLHILKSKEAMPYVVELMNGKTTHGSQEFGGSGRDTPMTYYTHDSGLGQAILNYPKRLENKPMRFGVIGLGAGMIASYCEKGDTIRFYEVNPQVIQVSKQYFTYLDDAEKRGCDVEIVEGDARISLGKELASGVKGGFDILVVDAFTDDSIPTHLLTREATDLYLEHLSEGGVIVFHTANRFFKLAPELESVASAEKLYFNEVATGGDRWVLMSKIARNPQSYIPNVENTRTRIWTDEYTNLLRALY